MGRTCWQRYDHRKCQAISEISGIIKNCRKKAGVIEKRRIWTDDALAEYIRDELGFPGARQAAMVEKERVDIGTGEVSREHWYLLSSLSSRRCGPKELLRVFRNHWGVENSLHHVKDRSWDEDVHTLRRWGVTGPRPHWLQLK